MSFIHFQTYSYYSLLRSPLSPDRLVEHAANLGYEYLALTDFESMTGVIEFYEACQSRNIHPIIGLTLRVNSAVQSEPDQMILIAKNNKGYQNLLKIATTVSLNENTGISLNEISSLGNELIAILTLSEEFKRTPIDTIRSGKYDQWIIHYKTVFPEFFIGVTPSYLSNDLRTWMNEKQLDLLAVPNVRYANKKEHYTKNLLDVIRQEKKVGKVTMGELNPSDTNRKEQLLSPEEHIEEYEKYGLKEAALKTGQLAQTIELEIDLGKPALPKYPDTGQLSSSEYLNELCFNKLSERIPNPDEKYKERLTYELKIIEEMGFSDYFLIVWDIIRFAHEENIFTGSGRGSSAGSLVAYVLSITDVDPIEYDLLFERFLNKERYTMPDIDLDFPSDRRQEILNYLEHKYSKKHVAQICTLGTYRAKSALREIGRVFGLDKKSIDAWSKAVPNLTPNETLDDAFEKSMSLQRLVARNEYNRRFFEIAKTLQGIPQNYSTHAAGVVLSEKPLVDRVPLMKSNMPLLLTQYTMEDVEKVGLLKLDILGLQNLTILSDCLKFSAYERKPGIQSVADTPMNDEKTLKIFQEATTDGIFQFESDGIKHVLRKLRPTNFEDIVAVIALYRPGPMQQIDHFIDRKHGKEPVTYPHEDLKPILEVTYGVMVYQEQIMRVATKLAGYSLNESDMLRRIVSKKDIESMKSEHEQFVKRAVDRGYEKHVAEEVFSLIERFADYGFNRSHAVAYSKVAYQLAYFKAHYPASFYAALLRSTHSSIKMNTLLNEAKLAKVMVEPPNINTSWFDYTVDGNVLRFGLRQIKGLQRQFVEDIIRERQAGGDYKNLLDFLKRIPDRWLDSNQIKPLIYSGAFDTVGEFNRGEMLSSLDAVIESVSMSHGSVELLEVFAPTIEPQEDINEEEKSEQEYEVLNYYFSNSLNEEQWEKIQQMDLTTGKEFKNKARVKELVMVQSINTIQTKKGLPMSFVKSRNLSDQITLVLFPNQHHEYIKLIKPQQYYIVEGTAEISDSEKKILVQTIYTLKDALKEHQKRELEKFSLCVQLQDMQSEKRLFAEILNIFKKYPGNISTCVYEVKSQNIYELLPKYFIRHDNKLFEELKNKIGEENYTWIEKTMKTNEISKLR